MGEKKTFNISEEDEQEPNYILELMSEYNGNEFIEFQGRKAVILVNIDNFTYNPGGAPRIESLYKNLFKEQANYLQPLIQTNFIDPENVKYVASSQLVGKHIIGNGFEIHYMNTGKK